MQPIKKPMTLDQHLALTQTPWGLRYSPRLNRYFLTRHGQTVVGQYGSMDRDTAFRVYKAYRDHWLA